MPEVISCHAAGLVPSWVSTYSEMGDVCSLCDSIRPERFVEGIESGEFICGFMWDGGGTPLFAYVGGYRFFSIHLQDMSRDWLYANAMRIFEATGVLFYWDGEEFCFDAIHEGVFFSEASMYTLTEAQREHAARTNDRHYYFGGVTP